MPARYSRPNPLDAKNRIFAPESHQKKRKVQHDLEKRHILIDKINIVSGRIPDLKLIISGAAGAASYMINLRFWSIPVLITADPGTIADIQILQISKMLLIKISDPVNKFLPVDRSSAQVEKIFCSRS